MHKQHWLIVANGEPVFTHQLLKASKNRSIIALDGAASYLFFEAGLNPHVVIGDLDSINTNLKRYLIEQRITVVENSNQDTADLEKGLCYLEKLDPISVVITNATGWRMDHSLLNLRLLKRYHRKFKSMYIMTKLEKIYYVENQKLTLESKQKEPLAVLSFPEATITSRGLKYDMQSLNLRLGSRESTSNTLIDPKASLSVKGSGLLIVSHATHLHSVESI